MVEISGYTYTSPLQGYEKLEPLSVEKKSDGPDSKSLINPTPTTRSEAYTSFTAPLDNGPRGGFDVHVYFDQDSAEETQYAKELHERIRREFPELRIYRVWEEAIGPHPFGMFEVNLHTPEAFGAFIPWLVIHRGPLSALLHPNTDDEYRDHTQRATWLGKSFELKVGVLEELRKRKEAE